MNPMGISAPWAESIDIISLRPVKVQGMTPMGLIYPWVDSLEVISLWSVIKISRY